MPRNKSIKRTKKRQKVSNIMVSVQKMEMDFMRTPAKMVAQLAKEISAVKKQENKLNKVMVKINKQMNKAESRMNVAAKTKNAAAGKKKLKVANRMYAKAAKAQVQLNKQLQPVSSKLMDLMTNQARFTALEKYLKQFNTEWKKSSRNAAVEAKPKKRKKKADTAVEQLNVQPADEAMTSFDEAAEMTS